MLTSEELRVSLAASITKARQKSGLSMNRLAALIGVSDKTIAAWEQGRSCPDMVQFIQVLTACGVKDIIREALELLYPNVYKGVTATSDISAQRTALIQYVAETATDKTVKQLFFLVFGEHGSNFIPQLQELMIHDSLPLESRIVLSELLLTLFEMNATRNAVDVPDPDVLPNIEHFRDGITKAKEAVLNGKKQYTTLIK